MSWPKSWVWISMRMLMTTKMRATHRRAVLGIDAAWTSRNPSGVALVVENEGGWELLAVDHSYNNFVQRATDDTFQKQPPTGSMPNAKELLRAATIIANCPVDLVSIDMPLSREPIKCRRASDNLISKQFGPYGCSTHTPSENRPGKLSDTLRSDFATAGYELLTSQTIARPIKGIAEVYPHPAMLALTQSAYRVPYKCSKLRAYWPAENATNRLRKLEAIWQDIIHSFASCLGPQIRRVDEHLTCPKLSDTGAKAKAFEDKIDAIVCAWVGVCLLENQAEPFGDDKSAIWVPRVGYVKPERPPRPLQQYSPAE